MAYWCLIILAAVILVAYLYTTRNYNYWKNLGVFQIPPTPFVGNFKDCVLLKKNPGNLMRDMYDQTKGLPYVGFYIFHKPSLLIRDKELITNVLIKDFNYFNDRYSSSNSTDRLGYASLFFLKNPSWKILRTKLTPVFTSGKLKKMFDLMLECAENLDVHLKSLLSGEEKMVDMRDIIAKFTTDMIGSTAYGLDVNSLNNPDAEFRKYGKMIFEYGIIRSIEGLLVFFLPDLVSITRAKVFGKETSTFLRKAFWEIINQRMESGQKRNDLIDILINFRSTYEGKDIGGFKFDGDDLVAQAAIFFAAGFETSSTTASFTLYELAVQPEIQNRLRREILDALDKSDGKITYDMTLSLPYLDMVVSETLRKYPTLPFLDRVSVETYKVPNSDLVIEKGTPIYISMLGMHMDPEYFPEPDKYDPERFNEENKRNRPSCIYLPFGEGPRACIGIRLGLLQTKLAVIQVVSQYELIPCEKTLIPMMFEAGGPTITPLGGKLYLNIRKINECID